MSVRNPLQIPRTSVAATYRAKRRKASSALAWVWAGLGIVLLSTILIVAGSIEARRRSQRTDASNNPNGPIKREPDAPDQFKLQELKIPERHVLPVETKVSDVQLPIDPQESVEQTALGHAIADPFAQLPTEVDLLAIAESVGPNVPLQYPSIGSLTVGALDQVKVRIDSAAASLDDGHGFEVVRAVEGEEAATWTVQLSTASQAFNADPLEVVQVRVDGAAVMLLPLLGSDHQLVQQVSNCVLQFNSGQHTHALRLRPVQSQEAVVLNLDEVVSEIPIEGSAIPPVDSLYFSVATSGGFPADWELSPPAGRARGEDSVAIKSPEGSSTNLQVEVQLREVQGRPILTIRKYYFRGKTRDVLAAKPLEARLLNVQRTFESNAAKLNESRTALPAVTNEVRRLVGLLASLSANDRRRGAVETRLHDLEKHRISLERAVVALNKSLPRTETALAYLNSVSEIATRLHNTAKIAVEVGIPTPNGDFPLLIAQ